MRLSQRDWEFRAYSVMRAPEQLLVPTIPAITFAREVPVSPIGTPSHKYKRFQWFEWAYSELPLTGLGLKNAKPTFHREILYGSDLAEN